MTGVPATGSRPPIRVVVADDAYRVREALKHVFPNHPMIEVVGECADGRDVVPLIDAQRADLLSTDVRMPPHGEDEGIRLAASLRVSQRSPVQLTVYWGAELTCLYNDAEREILGGLHPRALGMPAR